MIDQRRFVVAVAFALMSIVALLGSRPAGASPTPPLEVVVVIDTSDGMAGVRIDSARSALATFVRTLPPSVPVAVVAFGSRAAVAQSFSLDRDRLVAAIGALQPAGGAALYDAVIKASSLPRTATRRAIVLLSGTRDTSSVATIDGARWTLSASGARPIVVELEPDGDEAAVTSLTAINEGALLVARDAAALDGALRQATRDLVGRYGLVVEPPRHVREPAPRATPPTSTQAVGEPSELRDRLALPVGAGLVFVALALVAGTALVPTRARRRLAPIAGDVDPSPSSGGLGQLAQRATTAAERTLETHRPHHTLDARLEQAGVTLRPAELVVLVSIGAATALVIGVLLRGLLAGIALAIAVVLVTQLALTVLRDRRRSQFAEQLDDVLQILAGSLRSGYGLNQALESAAREVDGAAAEELRRLTAEARLGRDLTDSLDAMATRVGSDDFLWVGQAIRIHREVGGDLAEVLDHVSETIRARNKLRRQVAALSAEGRMSAYVLFVLPFAIGGLVGVLNPSYIGTLFTHGLGLAMVAIGAVLMAVGGLWLRQLIRPVY